MFVFFAYVKSAVNETKSWRTNVVIFGNPFKVFSECGYEGTRLFCTGCLKLSEECT